MGLDSGWPSQPLVSSILLTFARTVLSSLIMKYFSANENQSLIPPVALVIGRKDIKV